MLDPATKMFDVTLIITCILAVPAILILFWTKRAHYSNRMSFSRYKLINMISLSLLLATIVSFTTVYMMVVVGIIGALAMNMGIYREKCEKEKKRLKKSEITVEEFNKIKDGYGRASLIWLAYMLSLLFLIVLQIELPDKIDLLPYILGFSPE